MTKKEPKIKIFVSHHKPGYIYEDDVFVPIQVGKKIAKVDFGIQGDDTGDNISEKNSLYAELTTQYWVWKNYDLSNIDYIGFCHYRRYLDFGITIKLNHIRQILNKKAGIYEKCTNLFDYIFQFRRNELTFNKILINNYSQNTKEYIKQNLDKKIITYKTSIGIRSNNKLTNLELNNKELFSILYNIIIEKSELYKAYIEQLKGIKHGNYCNIFIMSKEIFLEYSDRLFSILFEFENEMVKRNLLQLGYDEPMTAGTRFLGCLAERLFNLFLIYKSQQGISTSKCATLVYYNI